MVTGVFVSRIIRTHNNASRRQLPGLGHNYDLDQNYDTCPYLGGPFR